jgi:hypothetical protein
VKDYSYRPREILRSRRRPSIRESTPSGHVGRRTYSGPQFTHGDDSETRGGEIKVFLT